MNVDILDGVLASYGLEQMTCVSGIEEDAAVALSVWPNPASDILQVEARPGTHISLLDLTGRSVLDLTAQHMVTPMEVATLPEGTYLLRSETVGTIDTRKVVIRH